MCHDELHVLWLHARLIHIALVLLLHGCWRRGRLEPRGQLHIMTAQLAQQQTARRLHQGGVSLPEPIEPELHNNTSSGCAAVCS